MLILLQIRPFKKFQNNYEGLAVNGLDQVPVYAVGINLLEDECVMHHPLTTNQLVILMLLLPS
jgi:hypothetical protein